MLKRLSNQNLGKLCISFVVLFLLSGCGEDHCIKPENLSGLREKLDIVSTEQKWVDSGVYISDGIRSVTEINIVPSKVNFCPKQYADFAIRPGRNDVTLPFAIKKDDTISFSVIGSKVCKDKESETKIRYVKIDEKCSEQETEHFAHVLNQEECQGSIQDGICPNKYIIGDAQWLNGKEYWFSKLDQDEKKIKNIINSIKQGENIDCRSLSDSSASEIDTRILNLLCGRICKFPSGSGNKGCAYIEYNSVEGEISRSDVEAISKILKEKQIKTGITLLKIHMDGEDFEYIPTGGICTNCDYKIEKYHRTPSLTFSLCSRNDEHCYDRNDKGGFNIRVTKNHSLKNNLYIRVSDKFPDHKPGEDQADISVDISQVHDVQYMESLKEKLKDKTGTIYYGIRDHGCGYKNEGQFSINLTTKEPPTRTFSAIYNFFDEKVKTAFFGSSYKDSNAIHSDTSPVKHLYESFLKSSKTNIIRSTIISLLVLYIILYTLYYFFGLTHISIYEFLIICVKIGVITQLLQDNSWNFFYNNAFSIFINTPKQLIEIANFRGTTSNVFEFLDLPLNRFLSSHSVLLIVSLIFSGPLGIVSFCLVIWGLITVSLSIFNALFSFITSIAIVALLLSLAPIFIICLLFAYTRQMFHNWVKNLARFAIHPVVLLIFISLISQVMDYIIYSVFDFEVCSTCILSINLKIFNPCIFYGYASKYTPNITAMMAFVILGHAMKALVKASSAISDSLFGAYVQNEPGKEYQQSLMGTVGLDEQSVQRRGGGTFQQSGASRPQIPQGTQRSTPQIPQPGRQQ
ncbi:type IV secretion system protein [Wolbachia endosymbiont of Listronotus oregonensis]|uniref:type IV secretion system protein n=1 Tax=Wolbachia endosymbiont of Listronotus oregonensis TaxID=2969106 RepID=UPI002814B5A2|nr:type IV secretion system protein [Wolbachia endosymbiont of Listronotus oregonensis]WMT85039.1 type IV secretion system protein [Wolbachia endosymbiont of Listronotus oregonensis]